MTAVIDAPESPDYLSRTHPGRWRSIECASNRHFCTERGCRCACHLDCACCDGGTFEQALNEYGEMIPSCATCSHWPRGHAAGQDGSRERASS